MSSIAGKIGLEGIRIEKEFCEESSPPFSEPRRVIDAVLFSPCSLAKKHWALSGLM